MLALTCMVVMKWVVFQKWRWPFSHCPSKGVAIDKQANDDVVHLHRFRETDRLADEALNARPQGEMLALDFLGVTFANGMLFGVKVTCIGFPIVIAKF